MHPAKEGFSSLPFFDEFDLSTVDILLISQYVTLRSMALPPPTASAWREKSSYGTWNFMIPEAALSSVLSAIYRSSPL